ncbi:hypothetical protein ACOSP7_008704 [Xanthoceras sorbifolium]
MSRTSKNHQVLCLLLLMIILISIHGAAVSGARHLKQMVEQVDIKPHDDQIWKESTSNNTTSGAGDDDDDDDKGFVAAINREVPSSPDPLHNK